MTLDLAALKGELGEGLTNTANDSVLQRKLDAAIGSFEESAHRNLRQPASGDPDVSIQLPVVGGIIRLPDARAITSITTVSAAPAVVDLSAVVLQGWRISSTSVWATIPTTDGDLAPAAVTVVGKFGITNIPATVVDGVLALAAHKWRSRGGESAAMLELPDGSIQQQFNRVSPAYFAAVRTFRVPVNAGITTVAMGTQTLDDALPEWFPYASY